MVERYIMGEVSWTGLQCPRIKDNGYVKLFSCNFAHELAALGAISLLLTIINIICIFFVGILVLKVGLLNVVFLVKCQVVLMLFAFFNGTFVV
jgi:hypothetical protein